jgi:hypothetical protein
MRNLVVLAGAVGLAALWVSAAAAVAPPEDYPPNALPGQCFAKVIVPEVTQSYSEQVLVAPEHTVTQVIPGACGSQDKTIVVRAPSTELITIPATYRTITETVVVRPGGVRTEVIPPVYDTVSEQVMVRQGYTEWRPSAGVRGYFGSYDAGSYAGGYPPAPCCGYPEQNPAYGGPPTRVLPTGEVLCLVQVPPEYSIVTRQVVRVPARTLEIPYPAETTTVTRQVVDAPAHVVRRDIPGETRVVQIKTCAPDQTQTSVIPPQYRTVTKLRTIAPARSEWRQTTCQAPTPAPLPPVIFHQGPVYHDHPSHPAEIYAPSSGCPVVCGEHRPVYEHARPTDSPPAAGDGAVARLQGALAAKGYYQGPQNGLFTPSTMAAMTRYQHDNHLAEGRYTGETANALGISR